MLLRLLIGRIIYGIFSPTNYKQELILLKEAQTFLLRAKKRSSFKIATELTVKIPDKIKFVKVNIVVCEFYN